MLHAIFTTRSETANPAIGSAYTSQSIPSLPPIIAAQIPIKAAIEENTSERCSYAFAIIASLFTLFLIGIYIGTFLLSR